MKKTAIDDKKDWLVKTSLEVFGPYSFQDLIENLKKRLFSVNDEVRRMEQRWTPFREHKDFTVVVQTLRFEQESGEKTMVTATPGSTNSLSRTEPISDFEQENTPAPFSNVETLEDNQAQRPAHLTGRAFGVHNDLRLQKEVEQKSSVFRWVLLGLAAFTAVGLYGYQLYLGKKKTQEYELTLRSALRSKNLQLYEKARLEYKKALSYKEPDLPLQIEMAPLLIAVDKETLKGRKILEKDVSQPGRSRQQVCDSYVSIGLSHLLEEHLPEAEEAFNKALSFDTNHMQARLNLAFIEFKKKNYIEALKNFEFIQAPTQAMVAVAQALITAEYVQQEGADKPKEKIDSALQNLQLAAKVSRYLGSQIRILAIYLYQLKGHNHASLEPHFRKLLDEIPRSQDFFVQDLKLSQGWLEAPAWEKVCQGLAQGDANSVFAPLGKAFCLMALNLPEEAQVLITETAQQNPKNSFVTLSQLNLQYMLHRTTEVSALLKLPELENFQLKTLYQAKICLESSDLGCAEKSFKVLLEQNPNDIFARQGLAEIAYKSQKNSEALNMIRLGLADEPQFTPLLALREEIEAL